MVTRRLTIRLSFCYARYVLVIALATGWLVSPRVGLAADGDLDPSFHFDGIATLQVGNSDHEWADVAVRSDGKIVAVGRDKQSNDFLVARYNADGTLDATFGNGGTVSTDFNGGDDRATAVRVLDDDKILVAGVRSEFVLFVGLVGDYALARYQPDGTLDTTFGTGGKVVTDLGTHANPPDPGTGHDAAHALAVQPFDGKIVVAGGSGVGVVAIARYQASGVLDASFGTAGVVRLDMNSHKCSSNWTPGDEFYDVGIQPDGKIVASGFGSKCVAGSGLSWLVSRFLPDGSLDTGFGAGGHVHQPNELMCTDLSGGTLRGWKGGYAVQVLGDESLLVAGVCNNAFALARYTPAGQLDPNFGVNGNGLATFKPFDSSHAFDMAIQSDGRVLLAGVLADKIGLARFHPSGAVDTSFGTLGAVRTVFGSASRVNAMRLQGDGKIVVAGQEGPRTLVARYLGTPPDQDGDGWLDGTDNCDEVPNSDQGDLDKDGEGDACDPDDDGDTVLDVSDNCPRISNAEQEDNDVNEHVDDDGDACDEDDDNDGHLDADDNCHYTANSNQVDTDGDGAGDVCDGDLDGDGVLNAADNCAADPNPVEDGFEFQADFDEDGEGDVCDLDDDNDGVEDHEDNCPLTVNPDQEDRDADEIGDACDEDVDGDGLDNEADNCPLVANADQAHADSDGTGDACDLDDDGDGVEDDADNCALVANADQENADEDSAGNACDPDDDNDGIADGDDNCALVANDEDQSDIDGDGLGDVCDDDDDNDGALDTEDNCPLVANPPQRDGDGVPTQLDGDGDGIGDACELDDDGDGVADAVDLCAGTPAAVDPQLRVAVDPDTGCSIAQLCPCPAPRGSTESWRNHGQYRSCIAKTSKTFVGRGLISQAKSSEIGTEASHSSCGQ